jgi:hypothetical protein
MKLKPILSRLRIISLACWAFGAWWMIQAGQLAVTHSSQALPIALVIAASILIAIGITFWLLGTDTRAGVSFDSKGVMLNLGHSAAFVGWENIIDAGALPHRSGIFVLGSSRQIGIRLRNPQEYLQSYEERIPAARGPLAYAVSAIYRLLRRSPAAHSDIMLAELRRSYDRTGYHLLIPETQLGDRGQAFIDMINRYTNSERRHKVMAILSVAEI